MVDMISHLKSGKSYVGFIRAEHILKGSPKLLTHLHILFNAMLQHSFIPTLMLRGTITPLVKDRDGDLSASTNYRPITLSLIFIQMYEMLKKAKFGYFLPKSELQFGFRSGISTSHAIFTLKKTANYFVEKNSRVFLAFLDCSKAFDKISHWGLFLKLVQYKVPLCFLLSVMFLYLNMSCTVKWNKELSYAFDIPTGTKQGGILSPDIFSKYLHDLIKQLQASGFGCHIIKLCIACIFFADDIVLLSPSRYGLQRLLDICANYCRKFCLDFNVNKSKVMIVSRKCVSYDNLCSLRLNDTELEYVHEYKYLGVNLNTGNGLCFPATSTIRSFHRAANSVLHGRVKPSQQVQMRLIYSNCVPILTYGCAVKEYSAADMRRCHVALNNVIRKIFSFAVWQGIRHIRISCGFKCVYELFERARCKFISSASCSANTVIACLASLTSD